jgi:hypothetical protein
MQNLHHTTKHCFYVFFIVCREQFYLKDFVAVAIVIRFSFVQSRNTFKTLPPQLAATSMAVDEIS